MKHNFFERQENRINYALDQVIKNKKESDSLYNTSQKMAKCIPMGQPIQIGHYSEKGDRNFRNKIWSLHGKSIQKQETADYYVRKAQTIANNTAISSDNPDALQLLRDKLKGLEDHQAFMKAANKFIKANNETGFLSLQNATQEQWTRLRTPIHPYGMGYQSFEITNNGACIRNVKKRIEDMEKLANRQPVDMVINGVRLFENQEANRIQLFFKGKPEKSIRIKLRKEGFIWCGSEIAWQKKITTWAIYTGKLFLESLAEQTPGIIVRDDETILESTK
jgi:hypothetical protein